MSPAGGYTAEQTARLVAGLRWATGRLADIVGSWALAAADATPEATVWLTALSRRLKWHREVLEDHQPDSVLLAPHREARPPSASLEAAFDELAALDGDAARVAVAHRVLIPRLSAVCAGVQAQAAPHCDSALASAAAMLGHDLRRQAEAGDGLSGLAAGGADAAEAADRRLAAADGILPDSLVRPRV